MVQRSAAVFRWRYFMRSIGFSKCMKYCISRKLKYLLVVRLIASRKPRGVHLPPDNVP